MLDPAVRRLVADARPPGGMATTIIAIDGYGGAGKSSLAAAVAHGFAAAGFDVNVLHTDDFASWDNPVDWWPRLLDQVLIPLGRNEKARYQRYDWKTRELAEWHEHEPGGLLIVEGVTSSREEFRPYLAGTIWVETPPALRLRRGLERDGEQARAQWLEWMTDERKWGDAYRPWARADLIVQGS